MTNLVGYQANVSDNKKETDNVKTYGLTSGLTTKN